MALGRFAQAAPAAYALAVLFACACDAETTDTDDPVLTTACGSDEDCPSGKACVEVIAGGFSVCEQDPKYEAPFGCEVTDDCCDDLACPGGRCVRSMDVDYCTDYVVEPRNRCVDDCTGHDECEPINGEPSFCLPPNLYGALGRSCVSAFCWSDADCTAEPGGVCAVIESGCFGKCSPTIGCVYPGPSACVTWDHCGDDERCVYVGPEGRATCKPFELGDCG